MNILILSAGGPTAHGVIKSLRDINFDGKIVSVDSNPLSAGLYLSDSYHIVPKAFDDGYIEELYKIVNKENIDLILPTSSNDIITISKNEHLFDCQLFMSDYEAIDICSNKLKFYEKCKDKFPLPKTSINYNDIDFPIFAKGRIVKNDFIEKSCFDICKFLNLKGPICLQMKEDVNGKPKFVEINPRLGGSSYFATLAGVNFIEIILDLIKGKKSIINKPKQVTILRYYNEVVI